MAVVTVPILDFLWGKRLLRRQIIGACLAAFGVFALELGGQQTTISDGDIMSLIQPIVFGLGFWRMEAAMVKYPTEAGRLAAAQLLTVFLVSLAYLVCLPGLGLVSDACDSMPAPTTTDILAWLSDPHVLGMFVWTGLITTAFTIWMETLALRTLSAAETTLIFSTEPLFGAAFAAVVAHECLGAEDAIGAFFIIVGCLVSGMDAGQLFGRGGGPTTESSETRKSLTTREK
jgi:drug/metabolite transporter (DMT)-like permease